MVTPAKGAAMKGPTNSLRENGARHGGRWFHLRVSTFQGSGLTRVWLHPSARERSRTMESSGCKIQPLRFPM